MAVSQSQPSQATLPEGSTLLGAIAEAWWLVLLRGIAAVVFGVLAFFWPGLTVLTLTFLWGFYALSDGIFALWSAISGKGRALTPRWWLAVVGVAGVVAGLLAFLWPGITAEVLLIFIAVWAIVLGVLQIVGAIQVRKEIEGEWLLIVSGLLSVAFGVLLILQPGAGLFAVVWLIATFAILIGVDYIALAFRLKKHKPAA
jgi:uncharacterized membrane protein HdeD (DUF308 family)